MTIEADEERVLSCLWIPRNFFKDSSPVEYEVFFKEIYEQAIISYVDLSPAVLEQSGYVVEDLFPSYIVTGETKTYKLVKPRWFINDGRSYYIVSMKKKGE